MDYQLIVAQYCAPIDVNDALLREWWLETEGWAERLGIPPNEVTARFRIKPAGLMNSNGYDLRRYRSRIAEELDARNIEELGLTRQSASRRFKALDWEFQSDYGRFDTQFSLLSFGINSESLRGLANMPPDRFVSDCLHRGSRFLHATYGFAAVMPKGFMPIGYMLGVASGEMPREMVWDANVWRQSASRQCDRTIRNVFGTNIINRNHLDLDIGGFRLEEWINANGIRGRIEPLANDLFLWTFQDGDDHGKFLHWDYPPVVTVRKELEKFKTFPWQKSVGVEESST